MKKLAVLCLSALFLLCISYWGLALYYRGGFSLNTWINGVYCTGRTVEDVNAELLSGTSLQAEITVTGYDLTDGNFPVASWRIDLRDAKLKADYTESLKKYLAHQDPWLWVDNITFHREHTLEPALSFETEKLRAQWEKITLTATAEEDYYITYR